MSLVFGLAHLPETEMLKNSLGLHAISSVFDVSWIIMVRNRMNKISGSSKGDKLWLVPFTTSILHVIYMQHKINLSAGHQLNS